ncbi:ATP-binding cassette domain-containing protein [Campylobacter sp. VicNov18]|uniref:ATP-binding cassette domain-containing protein n=1 Tax=Campylobacter bilis TaxID=2691918 RepID=UPI00130D5584|nr:ATP-binding cassette domain-containing protein [Campylobacter bilis]MPV63806.1 ATP-binding cassette domain-containing protein [Campylobacter hepaticus]MBM0637307.1 ATP-binding cassette domain-containing protein [Campylobacter bilis]MCC8278026.1 ATP-binding cassette domain-containing protein [Campylobacter bilis]MCC8299530.1 ATP-binding cassette domain-containing protein [Campylobacter bilis]MCC8300935.1 ATP-binding cassette domain-containing protein [Campylobacter bilis]
MKIRNLNISVKNKLVLKNVNFDIKAGKTLMILGESGVGKSLLGKALLRLLDEDFKVNAKELSFQGVCVFDLNKDGLRQLRSKVALVLQDAELSLYPYLDIGKLCDLVLKTHTNFTKKERKDYAFSYLQKLGFENLDLLWHSYANELSLGMARRVSLALALFNKPQILICDEITASLDEENIQKIMQILKEFKKDKALVCITHDLNLVRCLGDEILLLSKDEPKCYDLDQFLKSEYA